MILVQCLHRMAMRPIMTERERVDVYLIPISILSVFSNVSSYVTAVFPLFAFVHVMSRCPFFQYFSPLSLL